MDNDKPIVGFGPRRLFKMTRAEAIWIGSCPLHEMTEINGCVYLLKGYGRYQGLHKIGFSTNPVSRLASLKTSFGHRTRLVHIIWSEDPHFLESQFHKLFSIKQHIIGSSREWFNLSQQDIDWFCSFDAIWTELMKILERDRRQYVSHWFDNYTDWYEAS